MIEEKLIDELVEREGGYVNDPTDRGGETNYGITVAVAREQGYTGPMAAMPIEVARRIYRTIYWTRPGFDQVAAVSERIAEELFDTGVNCGVKVASTFLQRALNALNCGASHYPDMVVDGVIGANTVSNLRAFLSRRGMGSGEVVMLHCLDALQGARYIALAEARPDQEKYVYGWLANRVGNAL